MGSIMADMVTIWPLQFYSCHQFTFLGLGNGNLSVTHKDQICLLAFGGNFQSAVIFAKFSDIQNSAKLKPHRKIKVMLYLT